MHKTNNISGLAYLEYLIHKGIEEREKIAIKEDDLLEILNEIK